ncbi:MAG: hypothetical protein L6408_01885 [Nanoarchaeota archaeon]|nr:hypothetical protein [Nanoarchaeota archaeon]
MDIQNRKQMSEYLEDVMTKTYEKLKEERELEYEQNLLKTYIVESNLKSVHELPKLEHFETNVVKTEDKYLFILTVKKGEEKAQFFIDTINPRFWIFHSVGRSIFTDSFITKFIGVTLNRLDHPWFPTQFMEQIGEKEQFRGFTLKYENEFIKKEEDEVDNVPIRTLSMRLWGNTAPKVLNVLRKDDDLRHSVALSGVGIKHFVNHTDFVIDDISSWAKFTAKGTSIDGHFYIVGDIQKRYQNIITIIENNWLSYSKSEYGYRFEGQPLTIVLKKPVEDLNNFLPDLISSRRPFRLWGIRKFLDKDFVKINAIDLHTGDKLNMEMTHEWIRIYLPENTCGNTVLRLFTNIQHYYDSEAILEGGENGRIV